MSTSIKNISLILSITVVIPICFAQETQTKSSDCAIYLKKDFPLGKIQAEAHRFQASKGKLNALEDKCDSTVFKLSKNCDQVIEQRQNAVLNSTVASLLKDSTQHCRQAQKEKVDFDKAQAAFAKSLLNLGDNTRCRAELGFSKHLFDTREKNLKGNLENALRDCGVQKERGSDLGPTCPMDHFQCPDGQTEKWETRNGCKIQTGCIL